MNPFEFVLGILGIIFGYKLIEGYLKNRSQRSEGPQQEDAEQLAQRLAEVEARVEVLERIVTDDRYDLHRQFKDLGD